MVFVSFVFPFKYVALFALLVAFLLFDVNDGCTNNYGCRAFQVCCNYRCVYRSSCLGQSCSSDSGCSAGESCCSSKCVDGSSCVGQYCSSDADCSDLESCCNSKCKPGSDCWGSSCSIDSDCGNGETCCHGTCHYTFEDCNHDSTAAIIGPIIGPVVFISLISLCIVLACRCRRNHYNRAIAGQGTTTTTVTTTSAIHSNLPHQGQVPQSYQQGYPYYPPLQYQQPQQTVTFNCPPPYSPGPMAVSEQPPPYPAEPQGGSGGVYAPKTSYGAIPSAPPV